MAQDLVEFENGQSADADEINANFEVLENKISALEGLDTAYITKIPASAFALDLQERVKGFSKSVALPSLQALHEKYEDQGLRIIGVDPYDKIEDSIAPFLAKRGVTYLVLLDGKKVAKEYHVSAYPTMYLIGRNGKILFSQIGYSEEAEKKLEKIILEHL